LLAVEAITTEKLRSIRESFFERILKALSPRIYHRKGERPEVIEEMKKKASRRFVLLLGAPVFGLFFFMAVAEAGSLSAFWTGLCSSLTSQFSGSHLLVRIITGFFIVFFGVLALWGVCMIVGFVLYSIVLLPFRVSFATLEWIEANTANGIIGIVGFLLYLLGATIDFSLRWGAP
jgi:hypothetical protein